MLVVRLLGIGFLLGILSVLQADPLTEDKVPEPLKPWVDWVLQDADTRDCPFVFSESIAQCVWPSSLKLDLNDNNGQFEQLWQVYRSSTVRIPGNSKAWPQNVFLNGKSVVVLKESGFPVVKLPKGKHRIQGEFVWGKLPKSLSITPETGVVKLTLNGEQVQNPELNNKGRIWLNSGQSKADERDALDIQIFRKVVDSHPMQVETQIDLRVSGKQRDVELSNALLKDFIPLRVDSKLPARVDGSGKLRLQVRSGQWTVSVVGRSQQPLTNLAMPRPDQRSPKQEVWVFEAHNDLRLVQVEGVDSIDPRQTNLPSGWKALPAYRMAADKPMTLKVMRRGDPSPEPDKLSLHRDLWLDFDGNGYTARDRINGTMTQGWRLEAMPELQLGRVMIDGDPQFITKLPDSELKGVEVRRGNINLQADSRYEQERSHLPVSGWDHDFTSVSTTLHLPPGWKLLAAWGMDNVPNTWLQKWTLLDLFLVLIITVAVAHLWRWHWGVLALITLALIWHESNAPRFIWLNLIAAIALLRVIPDGVFKKLVGMYRNMSFVVLLLIIIPFMIDQVRIGLYPQLEKPWFSPSSQTVGNMAPAEPVAEMDNVDMESTIAQQAPPMPKPAPAPSMRQKGSMNDWSRSDSYGVSKPSKKLNRKQVLKEIDPKANIQTGPGLPNWEWNRVDLSWSGPVEKNESLDIIYVSPALNFILNLLRVFLVLVLTWRLISYIGFNMNAFKGWFSGKSAAANSVAAVLMLSLFLLPSPSLEAKEAPISTPSPEILQQLKERLLAPADCLPNCAQIERLRLQIEDQQLQGVMRVHAAKKVSIPLPGNAKMWLPEMVLLEDYYPAESIARNDKGELWVAVEAGTHDIVFQGRLPKTPQIQLVLPLKPHLVEWSSEKWSVDGIEDNGVPSGQLQINRVLDENAKPDDTFTDDTRNLLPAFLSVERTVRLGLDWTVDTVVRRLSPSGHPVVSSIPLLAGESVLTDNMVVRNKAVRVNLSANQNEIRWRSRLPVKEIFALEASKQSGFIETWKVETSPIWHVETKGIPVVHHQQSNGTWLPTWKPWTGEKVEFTVSKPQGVDGQTLTINKSLLHVNMGKRSDDVTLSFSLLSSQGTQHTMTLPDNAELHSVSIAGRKQPIRQSGNKVTLPVSPGSQEIQLEWREPHVDGLRYQVSLVDMGLASVNSQVHLSIPQDRWILWAGGPQLGPAVLFWGVLIVILIVSVILGRSKLAPVKTWQWFLLGIGLSQVEPLLMLIVIGWLVLLALREKLVLDLSRIMFNLAQVGYGLLTLVALIILFSAVADGLLGQPEMQISGNNSYGNKLQWFQDRTGTVLPQPWLLSVPLLVYRLLMLLWALWLAFTLLGWLRWGWERISAGGLWREKPKAETQAKESAELEVKKVEASSER